MSWNDGRPFGFTQWNHNHYTGLSPDNIQWLTTDGQLIRDETQQQLLTNSSHYLHPRFAIDQRCTGLLGTPGPHSMDFVSVNCDTRHHVSGTVCMSGGTTSPKNKQVAYSLNHWRVIKLRDERNGSRSAVSRGKYHFNINRYNEYGLNYHPHRTNLSHLDQYTRDFLETHTGYNKWTLSEQTYQCTNKSDTQFLPSPKCVV